MRPLPSSQVKAELCAMLKEGNDFYRVRILDKDKHGIVSCYKYDEGCVVKSTVSHIYPLDEQIKRIPESVMKCRLEGLEFFDGMPTLEISFRLTMMGNLLPKSFYNVNILQFNGQGIPLIRMIKDGLSLTHQIQEFIPTICNPHYPKVQNIKQNTRIFKNNFCMILLIVWPCLRGRIAERQLQSHDLVQGLCE
jgi:hypothetical protein